MTCEKLTWLANAGEQYLIPEKRDTGRMMILKKVHVEFIPLGVIGAIVPWNYPFHNVFNPVSAALFSGNACKIMYYFISYVITFILIFYGVRNLDLAALVVLNAFSEAFYAMMFFILFVDENCLELDFFLSDVCIYI